MELPEIGSCSACQCEHAIEYRALVKQLIEGVKKSTEVLVRQDEVLDTQKRVIAELKQQIARRDSLHSGVQWKMKWLERQCDSEVDDLF